MSSPYQRVFEESAAQRFAQEVLAKYGERGNISEETLNFDYLLQAADVAPNASSPLAINVMERANTFAQGNEVRLAQDPKLQAGQNLPGDQLIMVGAVRAIVDLGSIMDDADASSGAGTQMANALKRSVFVCRNGANKRFRVLGDECMSFGDSTTAALATGVTGAQAQTDRQKLITPFIFGQAQRLDITHLNDQLTAWPVVIPVTGLRIRLALSVMIGQIS